MGHLRLHSVRTNPRTHSLSRSAAAPSSAPSPTRRQRRSGSGAQRRRGSPRLGGGVSGSPSRLSSFASRPRLRPPRTGRRPCVRTSLSPPASAVPWEPGQLPRVAGPWLRRWLLPSFLKLFLDPLLSTRNSPPWLLAGRHGRGGCALTTRPLKVFKCRGSLPRPITWGRKRISKH